MNSSYSNQCPPITHWRVVNSNNNQEGDLILLSTKSLYIVYNNSGWNPVQRKKTSLHNSDDNSMS